MKTNRYAPLINSFMRFLADSHYLSAQQTISISDGLSRRSAFSSAGLNSSAFFTLRPHAPNDSAKRAKSGLTRSHGYAPSEDRKVKPLPSNIGWAAKRPVLKVMSTSLAGGDDCR